MKGRGQAFAYEIVSDTTNNRRIQDRLVAKPRVWFLEVQILEKLKAYYIICCCLH